MSLMIYYSDQELREILTWFSQVFGMESIYPLFIAVLFNQNFEWSLIWRQYNFKYCSMQKAMTSVIKEDHKTANFPILGLALNKFE